MVGLFEDGDKMSDVQSQMLRGSFKLTRVGVTEVKKPVNIQRDDKNIMLTATFDIFVDLPAELKGSHLSRNLEVLSQVLDESVRGQAKGLESLGARICTELLNRHEYATCSEVHITADYFMEREVNGGTSSLENYLLKASAVKYRDGEMRKSIGVEVIGMTACPCAMEEVRDRYLARHPECKELLETIPIITHNQRNISSLVVEVPGNHDVEADDLINLLEGALSSSTREILKRKHEADIVERAHANPKFVEDVVRDVLSAVLERYNHMPDDVKIIVKSESQESIHKHNAFAERVTTLGELKE